MALKTDLKTFKEVGNGGLTGKAQAFMEILENHGECQIYMASEKIHSIHLGDTGKFTSAGIVYVDKTGAYNNIFWDQVEMVNFHLGYLD